MPQYLTDGGLWIVLWPLPVIGVGLSLAIAALARDEDTPLLGRWIILSAFAVLGVTVGFLTGQSREAAVAATVGAVLSLVAAGLAYLLGKGGAQKRVMASAAILIFSVLLLFGANWGAYARQQFVDYREGYDYRLHKAIEEQNLRDAKRMLGIDIPE